MSYPKKFEHKDIGLLKTGGKSLKEIIDILQKLNLTGDEWIEVRRVESCFYDGDHNCTPSCYEHIIVRTSKESDEAYNKRMVKYKANQNKLKIQKENKEKKLYAKLKKKYG